MLAFVVQSQVLLEHGSKVAAVVAAAVVAVSLGCGRTVNEDVSGPSVAATPEPTPIPVVPVPVAQPVAVPQPAPVPVPAPSSGGSTPPSDEPTAPPPASGESGPFRYVWLGFFGFDCPPGTNEPGYNQKKLPIGCRGYVTATPKYADGTDVPFEIHGPDIYWELRSGHSNVTVLPPLFPNAFNKDLFGDRLGGFNLCATVRGVTGCMDGQVVPQN
jgi:hypothetical protein